MNKLTRSLAVFGLALVFSAGAVLTQIAPARAQMTKPAGAGKKVVQVKAHTRINKKTGKMTMVKASTRTIGGKKAPKMLQVKGYTKVNKKTGKVTQVKGYTRKAPTKKAGVKKSM